MAERLQRENKELKKALRRLLKIKPVWVESQHAIFYTPDDMAARVAADLLLPGRKVRLG